jgi:hypothetical protein
VGLRPSGLANPSLRGIPLGAWPAAAREAAAALRGLNENHHHELKALFKSTATRASTAAGPFGEFYAALLATGMRPTMARLTVARKIAAIFGRSGSRESI